jgi:hypothetical protein
MHTYEVTFHIATPEGVMESQNMWLTTRIQAFDSFKAEAMVRGQYGRGCQIVSCYQID